MHIIKINKKRHKILKLLSDSFIKFNSNIRDENFKLGISFDELQRELKCNRHELEIIIVSMYNQNEVKHTNVDVYGLISTSNGFDSYVDKKYLKANTKIIINILKNFTQIVIPVLSLVVAILTITIKLDILKKQYDKELQRLETTIKKQQERILLLESETKNPPNLQKNNLP